MEIPDSTTKNTETATVYQVSDEPVVGILHMGHTNVKTGVVFVVGGRQYRTGAHRQFVRIARSLAAEGFSVFRFDLRGMGDSAAEPLDFLDTAPDISGAVEELRRRVPSLEKIILWGLCDGASASIVYASSNQVAGVIMVNPWITTTVGAARTTLRHYYLKRILSAEFWKRFVWGRVNGLQSLRYLYHQMRRGFVRLPVTAHSKADLPDLVCSAIESFTGKIAVITSEKDLTAKEFNDELVKRYRAPAIRLPRVSFFHLEADHTFSTIEQHEKLQNITLEWCIQLPK